MKTAELQVKVCGITQMEQIQQLDDFGIDYIGIIFYPLSARYADNLRFGKNKMPLLKTKAKIVAVFVNPTLTAVQSAIQSVPGIRVLQFHGMETPAFCASFSKQFAIIKALQVSEKSEIEKLTAPYNNCCDYFLFDTASEKFGGTGKKFNWALLKDKKIERPFFLSGGIGAEDILAIQAFKHSSFYGIDMNSRFELEPGIKDIPKLQHFIHQIKK
jgi:phosphoribosylanthranilate isomerase